MMAITLTYITLQIINFVASLSLVCGTIHVRKKFFSHFRDCALLFSVCCDWLTIQITKTVFPSSNPQKRPKLVIVWLVSQAFIIAFWTFGSVLTNDINMTLYAVLFTYFWICIFSLYKEMNLELYQQSLHYSIQAVWIKCLIMQQMCMCVSMSIDLRKELTYNRAPPSVRGMRRKWKIKFIARTTSAELDIIFRVV